jgi:transposase
MQDLDFLATVLGLTAPWRVVHADLDLAKKGSIEAVVAYEGSGTCPTCGEPASIYDHRERRWRHLDLFQYVYVITAQVPRVKCNQHGVLQMPVPWGLGDRQSRLHRALRAARHCALVRDVDRRGRPQSPSFVGRS